MPNTPNKFKLSKSEKKRLTKQQEQLDQPPVFKFEIEASDSEFRPKITKSKRVMATLKLAEFDYNGDPLTVGNRWDIWLQRFSLYTQANKISDEDIIKSHFFILIGTETHLIYETLKTEGENFEAIKGKLTGYFTNTRSRFSERARFHNLYRRENESINDFYMRLRAGSKH